MGQVSTIENAEAVHASQTTASKSEQEREARMAAYLAEPKELPKSDVDEDGRLLAISDEELNERWERYLAKLAEIGPDDDPPGTWEQMAREINEDRVFEGRGPAFSRRARSMARRIVVLDSGPVGIGCKNPARPDASAFLRWITGLRSAGVKLCLPEIADYEVRRKLIHLNSPRKEQSCNGFDELADMKPIHVLRQDHHLNDAQGRRTLGRRPTTRSSYQRPSCPRRRLDPRGPGPLAGRTGGLGDDRHGERRTPRAVRGFATVVLDHLNGRWLT